MRVAGDTPAPAGRRSSSSAAPSAPATCTVSPTGSRTRSPKTTSPPRSTWSGPRSTRSRSPPASCCSSTRNGGSGRNGCASSCSAPRQPAEDQPGQAFPGGEIYLSFPGLGRRLAARIAGETGEHTGQFTTPNSLQCYAGRAPVTRRSGNRDLVVARRLACNRYLADAMHKQAFASLRRSAWAREFYHAQRARGKTTTRPCAHPAIAGSKSCGTASSTTCPTTRPSTSPTATGPSARQRPDLPSQTIIPDRGTRGLTEDVSSRTPDGP